MNVPKSSIKIQRRQNNDLYHYVWSERIFVSKEFVDDVSNFGRWLANFDFNYKYTQLKKKKYFS